MEEKNILQEEALGFTPDAPTSFGEAISPIEEEKINAFELDLMEQLKSNWILTAAFHKNKLDEVKKRLGSKCTYLSYLKQNNKYYFKAIMIKDGKKGEVIYSIGTDDFKNVTSNNYEELYETLNSGNYELQKK